MELKELIRQVLWQMYQSSLQNAAGLERVDAVVENAIGKEGGEDADGGACSGGAGSTLG
ncbi:MAG: hypothetical protein II574_03335 [Ruminococcus sp.]|nr:hypothetical protein [Ruminococcus sp.]